MRLWMCALALAASGCVEVAVGPTPYYLSGPPQLDPPQGDIPGGTSLWVLWKQDGFSQVVTPDGEAAWVLSNSLVTLDQWEKIRRNMSGEPDSSLVLTPEQSSDAEWQLYFGNTPPTQQHTPQPTPPPRATLSVQPGASPRAQPSAPSGAPSPNQPQAQPEPRPSR